MGLNDLPLFQIIKGHMAYITQRERVISENVANADTPGFAPRDLTPFSVAKMDGQGPGVPGLALTDPAHISGRHAAADPYRAKAAPDSETRLDGNQVVLEEQMSKMTDSRMDYEAAVDFYQRSLNLIATAARAPGK